MIYATRIWLPALVAVIGAVAQATPGETGTANGRGGHGAGNGGDGVWLVNNHLTLLDFAEAGVAMNPYFAPDARPLETAPERLARVFTQIEGVPLDLLARKLGEISRLDPKLAYTLLMGIEKYTWRFSDLELANVPDEGSLVDPGPRGLEQLAIRSVRTIRINKRLWLEHLDEQNRVGLILHEIIYAFARPDADGGQSSRRARELVGYLFTPDYIERGAGGLFHAGMGGFSFECSGPHPQARLVGETFQERPHLRLSYQKNEESTQLEWWIPLDRPLDGINDFEFISTFETLEMLSRWRSEEYANAAFQFAWTYSIVQVEFVQGQGSDALTLGRGKQVRGNLLARLPLKDIPAGQISSAYIQQTGRALMEREVFPLFQISGE